MDSRKTFQGTIHSQRIFNSESNSFIYKQNTEDRKPIIPKISFMIQILRQVTYQSPRGHLGDL